jgi:hypothetical protein
MLLTVVNMERTDKDNGINGCRSLQGMCIQNFQLNHEMNNLLGTTAYLLIRSIKVDGDNNSFIN